MIIKETIINLNHDKTSQELRMLSNVTLTLNWQLTVIFANSGSLISIHKMYLSLSLSLTLFPYWPGHISLSLWSNVSKISLWRCSLNVFLSLSLFLYLSSYLSFCHHSGQKSQELLFDGVLRMYLSLTLSLYLSWVRIYLFVDQIWANVSKSHKPLEWNKMFSISMASFSSK